MADQRLRGYASLKGSYYHSHRNNLFPDKPGDPDNQVTIKGLELGYTVRLNRALDAGASLGFNRFSGKKFEPFSRGSITPLNLEFAPLALPPEKQEEGKGSRSRMLKVGLAVTMFFPGFEGSDFCDRDTTTCSQIREFKSHAELIPRLSIVIDTSLFRR
jgi:hypothetical protein